MKRPLPSPLLLAIPLMVAAMAWFLTGGGGGSGAIIAGSPDRETVALIPSEAAKTQITADKTAGMGPPWTPGGQASPAHHNGFSATFQPGRPGAVSVLIPPDAPESAPQETAVLPPDFLEKMIDASGERIRFTLPDGTSASGTVSLLRSEDQSITSVQGRMETPEAGEYFFQKQTTSGTAGAMVGHLRFDQKPWAWKISPTGPDHAPLLHTAGLSQVICVGKAMPDSSDEPQEKSMAASAPDPGPTPGQTPQNVPQAHPTNMPLDAVPGGIIPLESLPGAPGVIYLDFDGEPKPFSGWSSVTTNAAPSGNSNTQIKDIWQRVAEDFQPFNLNVTTDRRVFDRAPATRRQQVIITPTTTASPDAGGVAFIGSFNWTGNTVCWVFVRSGKNAAEAISHEVGHTLGLSHDGSSAAGEYYPGHGSGDVSWAPLMGAGYTRNVTQWSAGDYLNANNTQDDLSIIVKNNNSVDYRPDDTSSTWATAKYLDFVSGFSVSNEGTIETRADVDAWRFETGGGPASLAVSTVDTNPNLDLLAEIYDQSDRLIVSQNPDLQLDAAVTANLPAGQYTLRVSGVGRGDPKTTGYSDYGSLGAYLISGTISNGIRHPRFTLPENTPAGTLLGTITPRMDHASHPVSYAIASGNTGGAFAINPESGQFTVANAGVLNYETLSAHWDDPSNFELFVTITDSVDPLLTENMRVAVIINQINEAPTLTAGNATLFTRTRPATPVLTVTGSDPDRYDFFRFSIAADSSGGAFAIDPLSGLISLTINAPSVVPVSPYQLTVRATDQGTPALSTDLAITITVLEAPANYRPGGLQRTWYEGIPGSSVNNLVTSSKFIGNRPDAEAFQSSSDSGSRGTNYGSTARAWLLPPASGSYTFWISGDDSAELWLSSSDLPAAASVRASAPASTGRYEYDRYPSQRSTPVILTAGTPYYLEARHKQGNGSDHLVIAWEGPGLDRQIISGLYLVPFYLINSPPRIDPQTFTLPREADTGTRIGTVIARDNNVSDPLASFIITGGTAAPWCAIDTNSGLLYLKDAAGLRTAATPANLTVQVSDNDTPPLSGTGLITLDLIAQGGGGVSGGLVQEIWTNIAGASVSALISDPRYPDRPTTTRPLTKMDTGADYGGNYGSRIRAVITAPATGTYHFYIASEDASELLFAPNASNWSDAPQIASVGSSTGRNVWNRLLGQKSVPFNLKTGQRAYLEVRHKAGSGPDFVQVAWTTPGSSTPVIISAPALSAFDDFEANSPPVWSAPSYQFSIRQGSPAGTIAGTVRASDPDTSQLNYTLAGGNPNGAFSLNPFNGNLVLTNPAALIPGQALTLSLRVQDEGTGGRYPLKTALTTAIISVVRDFVLLSPWSPSVNLPTGQGLELETAASGRPEATVAWSKVSGPGDVVFDDPGTPSTGASFSTSGFYVIRATETAGGIPLTLDLTVQAGDTPALPRGDRIGLQKSNASHNYNSGTWQISAGGSGLANATADNCYFINQTGTAEVVITARISNVQNIDSHNSIAGLMIREGPAPDARSVFCGVTSGNGLVAILRSTSGLPSRLAFMDTAGSSLPPFTPVWLRLERRGTSFTAFSAPDVNGIPGLFKAMRPAWTLPMEPACLVGLAATSGSFSDPGTSTIDGLTITPSKANTAPVITTTGPAGLSLQDAATLTGSILDDSLPSNPGAVTSLWKKVSGPGTVAFGNITSPVTTARFSSPGSYQLRLSAEDGEVRTFRDVLLAVGGPPIEEWRRGKFGEITALPGQSGDLADPDQDNLDNLLEYALGLEPLVASIPDLSPVISELEGVRYPGLRVSRNPGATDITMVIETTETPELASSWVTTGTVVEIDTPSQLRARTTIPMNESQKQFLRLKVSR